MYKQRSLRAFTLLATVFMSVLSLVATAATISNPVAENSITIDANIDDWATISSLGYDATTLTGTDVQADYLEGWIAHDSNSVYIAYRNNGVIDRATWWSWQVYFDTDGTQSTGYNDLNVVGAEYLLQGSVLYKYTGTGVDWSWQYIDVIPNAIRGAIAEFQVPRSLLGSPTNIRTVFKARNSAFTGRYLVSDIDTYPKSFAPLSLHDDLLLRQSAIWREAEGILSMQLSRNASIGDTRLQMNETYPLVDDQLITYRSTNDEYYTAQVSHVSGQVVTLKAGLKAPIRLGKNIWNFYANGSHPNTYGYKAIADFAIRDVGLSILNTGRHVLLGDSWFGRPGVGERLSERLSNATIINRGTGGDTATILLNRFDADVANQSPDFVWVSAGVNDYHRDVPASTYLASMQAIIAKINNMGAKAMIFDAPVAQMFFSSDERQQLSHQYAEGLSGTRDGYVDYELGVIAPPPETGTVSNPKVIDIDGNLADWEGLQSFGADGDDINLAGSRADLLEAWMAHDDSTFYVAYRNDGDIDPAAWWAWQVYLDTDNDENTGYKAGNGIGADYIIQGGVLHRYIGSGRNWALEHAASANYRVNANLVELAFPREMINNPSSVSVMMKARNGIFTGNYLPSGIDYYPNRGNDHFNYKFAEEPTNNTFSNRVDNASINLDGNLDDWQTITSFGRDPDDIMGATQQADWLEAWAAHDDDNLYFAYENDGDISALSWPYHIYIDADNDPSTGFNVSTGIGAEFVLEGPTLRRYSGFGSNWSWDTLPVTGSAIVGAYSEIAIPRSTLGVTDFRVVFKGSNQPFTGSFEASSIDYLPDNAASSDDGYLSYSIQ